MPTLIVTPKPAPVGFTVKTEAAASHTESVLIADFGSIPPEINSARMYAGAGGGPLSKAAVMWDALSADLYATEESHRALVSALIAESWLGPASVMMVAATTPYLNWLHDTAALAARTAQHARAAVAAYEAARAMTIPPQVVAANRAQWAAMAGANALGTDSHAISAVEAQYREMWAQDSTAMYMYADTSAKAASMIPFLPPPGAYGDVAHVATSSAIVQALQRLASPSRMGASMTGARAFVTPIHTTAVKTVVHVAVNAGIGQAAKVGRLSTPQGWLAAAPAAGRCHAEPITTTPAVPMMPTTRTARPAVSGFAASRSGRCTVIRMRTPAG